MRHLSAVLLALSFLVSCQQSSDTRKINGTILGANGTPMAMAHVHIIPVGGDYQDPLMSQRADDDGSFSLTLPDKNYYEIVATGVNHQKAKFPLIADHDKSISIDIRLAVNAYKEDFSEVTIFGNWNEMNPRTASPMAKQDDETWIFELETDLDSVVYQLNNIDQNGHTVNGTSSDAVEYDGGGDYQSIVYNPEGKVRIVFDPSKLPRSSNEELPSATYDAQNKGLETISRLITVKENVTREWRKKRRAYAAENGSTAGFSFDYTELDPPLRRAINSEGNPLVRRYGAILLGLSGVQMEEFPIGRKDLEIVTDIVPITDPLWQTNAYYAMRIFEEAMGEEAYLKHLEKNLAQIDAPRVRAFALIALGFEAKKSRNKAEQTRIYNELDSLYSHYGDLEYFISNLNPDLRISPGKPVPEFSVNLLGQKKTVTDKTFRGTYLMLDFWATWCGPCVAEMPEIHRVYEEFKNENFALLSLSLDRSRSDVDKFRKERWKMPWLHTFLEGGGQNEIVNRFEVTGIPKPILIDPDGIIIAVGEELRGSELKQTLSKYLEKS